MGVLLLLQLSLPFRMVLLDSRNKEEHKLVCISRASDVVAPIAPHAPPTVRFLIIRSCRRSSCVTMFVSLEEKRKIIVEGEASLWLKKIRVFTKPKYTARYISDSAIFF